MVNEVMRCRDCKYCDTSLAEEKRPICKKRTIFRNGRWLNKLAVPSHLACDKFEQKEK